MTKDKRRIPLIVFYFCLPWLTRSPNCPQPPEREPIPCVGDVVTWEPRKIINSISINWTLFILCVLMWRRLLPLRTRNPDSATAVVTGEAENPFVLLFFCCSSSQHLKVKVAVYEHQLVKTGKIEAPKDGESFKRHSCYSSKSGDTGDSLPVYPELDETPPPPPWTVQ